MQKFSSELTDEQGEELLESLKSQQISDDYELVDVREYGDDNISTDEWAKSKTKKKLSAILAYSFKAFAVFVASKKAPNMQTSGW